MKLKFTQFLLVAVVSIAFSSCKKDIRTISTSQIQGVTSQVKYAKGFEIQQFKDFKKLIIKAPYPNAKKSYEFNLTHSKSTKRVNDIQLPISSVVVTSTTHIPFLELLNVQNKLVGFPNTDYVSSEKTRNLIENGTIQELGNEESMNTELLLDLKPDVVIGFSLSSNNKMFATIEKLGIPVLLNGDWLEETPLGRAEWIKFFGVLFDKEKEADSIFNTIEKNYLEAKTVASKSLNKPTIISGGLFKDIWNLPAGESFEAAFLNDANTSYLWKESKGKGSLSLNIENVFEKGKDAEIWISPSFYKSLEEIKKANDIYPKFEAFQNKKIYSFVNKRGKKGGIVYFELAPARPDLVLKDLIKITHPELLTDHEFTFFEKL
jgi:iron complex transport system substrate-binding protein